MAADTRVTGANLVCSFAGTDIEGDFTSVTVNEEGELIDVTAGDETARYFITTDRENHTVDYEAFFEGTTTVWAALDPNAAGTLIVGPQGTASGNEKWTWTRALVQSRSREFPFDGAQTISVSFQCSSAKTEGTY